jgi:acetyltransferase
VDLGRLEQLLVRFSQLVVEQRWIKELDVNPLLASADRLIALDARVVLHEPGTPEADLPRPAIRPYPTQWSSVWQTRDGVPLTIRAIRPEDEPLMAKFHEGLSDRSIYLRYLHPIALASRIAHERLSRICFVDYDRDIVLVAERADADTGARDIVGVGRLSRLPWTDDAEFALLISDRFQGRGLGSELLRRLIAVSRGERIQRIIGYISSENQTMQQVARELGFKSRRRPDDPTVIGVWLDL